MMNRIGTLLGILLVALGGGRMAVAANVDGAPVHWTSTGNGPLTVVFVHGWTCDESSWSAAVHEVPGTGHFLMLEKPAEFNKLLGDFLATIR